MLSLSDDATIQPPHTIQSRFNQSRGTIQSPHTASIKAAHKMIPTTMVRSKFRVPDIVQITADTFLIAQSCKFCIMGSLTYEILNKNAYK